MCRYLQFPVGCTVETYNATVGTEPHDLMAEMAVYSVYYTGIYTLYIYIYIYIGCLKIKGCENVANHSTFRSVICYMLCHILS